MKSMENTSGVHAMRKLKRNGEDRLWARQFQVTHTTQGQERWPAGALACRGAARHYG